LQHNTVVLIFLDINMLDLTGIQFLKAVVHQPLVIFTTAYSEYAVDSYDYDAVDYLLKPIEFERFLKAANRALIQYQVLNKQLPSNTSVEEKESILVKSGTDFFQLKVKDILYVEIAGNYVNFVTADEKVMSLYNMKDVLEMLPTKQFFRIHKSYIIALRHVDLIERHQVKIKNKPIPIGNVYRESFFQAIENQGA